MSIILRHDGDYADVVELDRRGFGVALKDPRDLRAEREGLKFNFVGFISNTDGDLLVVLPKHFEPREERADLSRLFRLVTGFRGGSSNRYVGSDGRPEYTADYPFAAFYEVYDHYRRWGLDSRVDRRYKTVPPGRVNWRKTFQGGGWMASAGGPFPYPLVYDSGRRLSTFITECTIFAIDHTLEKFSFFLDFEPTGALRPAFDLGLHRQWIVENLRSARAQTFRDASIGLIDSLIAFFGSENIGGTFSFKQYGFHLVWEELVRSYLNRSFAGFDLAGRMVFESREAVSIPFTKKRFQVNAAYDDQFMEPDYYAESPDGRSQYIIDAKYYTAVKELNYKQLSYTLILDRLLDGDGNRRFDRTYSALVLPARTSRSGTHFAPHERVGMRPDITITEEYLDARKLVEDYFRS